MRTWVLCLVLLSVTGYLVSRSLNLADDSLDDSLVAALEQGVGGAESLTAPMALEGSAGSANSELGAPEDVAEPGADGIEAVSVDPDEEGTGPGAAPVADVSGPITFRKPGGGVVENREEARREADALVRRAAQEESPIRVATLLTKALRTGGLGPTEWEGIYEAVVEINKSGLLNPEDREGCYTLEVQAGDSLWKICRKVVADGHSPVAPGILRLLNGFSGNSIYLGQRLKVPVEPVWVLVEKGNYRLSVLVGEIIVRRYHVGLGKDGSPTPEGTFHISTLQKEPSWFQPGRGEIPFGDPDNVLGTRWMGFKERPTFGVHGTWEPDTIGGNFSNGCIRMRNAEVEELFDWIPRGTRIEIQP